VFAQMLETALDHSPCLAVLAVICYYLGLKLDSHRKAVDKHRDVMHKVLHPGEDKHPPPPPV